MVTLYKKDIRIICTYSIVQISIQFESSVDNAGIQMFSIIFSIFYHCYVKHSWILMKKIMLTQFRAVCIYSKKITSGCWHNDYDYVIDILKDNNKQIFVFKGLSILSSFLQCWYSESCICKFAKIFHTFPIDVAALNDRTTQILLFHEHLLLLVGWKTISQRFP